MDKMPRRNCLRLGETRASRTPWAWAFYLRPIDQEIFLGGTDFETLTGLAFNMERARGEKGETKGTT